MEEVWVMGVVWVMGLGVRVAAGGWSRATREWRDSGGVEGLGGGCDGLGKGGWGKGTE